MGTNKPHDCRIYILDYPKVRIIVTSRIVGYKRKILDDAGFVHFTLQDFEKEQIETFLDRWYPSLLLMKREIESRKSTDYQSSQGFSLQ